MPFLEGVPCSIHGVVFPDAVAVFRPVEMVTLRTPTSRLRYAGCSTFYDPPGHIREEMRGIGRRVGETLRRTVAFRASFTVDGIVTDDGFYPTEMNPRSGGGLATLGRGLPDLSLNLLHKAVAAGVDADWRPAELEALVVERADASRTGGGWTAVERLFTDTLERTLPDGTLSVGPGNVGGFVRYAGDPGKTPRGPSIAARVCDVFGYADTELGTGIGPVTPPGAPSSAANPARPRTYV